MMLDASFTQNLLDPILGPGTKGFPPTAPALHRSAIALQGWSILDNDLPYPIALIRQSALQNNLQWMQGLAQRYGVQMAPHGKTTMSPQLFQAQLQTGAWGMTVSTVAQLQVALHSGVQRSLIANELVNPLDLAAIRQLQRTYPELDIYFLVDSQAQLDCIEQAQPDAGFKVLLEIGVMGGRTGLRDSASAQALARAVNQSSAVRLAGVECYEGLAVTADNATDKVYADALLERVHALVTFCDREGLFEVEPALISAGGSAIFDLVLPALTPKTNTPLLGLLRSGCYITHDHGFYQRMVKQVNQRLSVNVGCGTGLEAAMEVWAIVQSLPEPNLAIVSMGKRDISYDIEMPIPLWHLPKNDHTLHAVSTEWSVSAMNDQHAYLRLNGQTQAIAVGDRVVFGVSHPCTTFDKWRWLPIVDDAYRVIDAIVTCF